MPRNDWYYRFKKAGMIQSGHVVLSSGFHSERYINCAYPLITLNPIVRQIIEGLGQKIRVLPAQKGGPIAIFGVGKGAHYARLLAEWAQARHPDRQFLFLYGQRQYDGTLFLPYNQMRFLRESEVIIFDDAYMTGRTFRDIARLINGKSQRVLQFLTIVNRSEEKFVDDGNLSFMIESLVHVPTLRKWKDMASCPLCKKGIPYSTSIEGGKHEFHQHGQPVHLV